MDIRVWQYLAWRKSSNAWFNWSVKFDLGKYSVGGHELILFTTSSCSPNQYEVVGELLQYSHIWTSFIFTWGFDEYYFRGLSFTDSGRSSDPNHVMLFSLEPLFFNIFYCVLEQQISLKIGQRCCWPVWCCCDLVSDWLFLEDNYSLHLRFESFLIWFEPYRSFFEVNVVLNHNSIGWWRWLPSD